VKELVDILSAVGAGDAAAFLKKNIFWQNLGKFEQNLANLSDIWEKFGHIWRNLGKSD